MTIRRPYAQVRDSPTTLKLDVAKGAIDLANLPDLEPVDVWIDLVANRGFGPTKVSRPAGRILLRLTYKSYVDDEDEGRCEALFVTFSHRFLLLLKCIS